MNNNRLALFRAAINSFASKKRTSARKLYTDQIYPYPFNYVNTKKWPTQHNYRETYPDPPWLASDNLVVKWVMRMFWTSFFYQLFHDPGVILGHFHPPDPTTWTDAELGIPPLEEGSYVDWFERKSLE